LTATELPKMNDANRLTRSMDTRMLKTMACVLLNSQLTESRTRITRDEDKPAKLKRKNTRY
jgi:hypothetical protein